MGFSEWLSKLKKLFHLEFNAIKNLKIENLTVNLINDSSKGKIEFKGHSVQLNLDEIDNEVFKLIQELVEKECVSLIEEKAEKTIEDFRKNDHSSEVKNVINILRNYIPSGDISILRASFFLRKCFNERSSDVARLKDEIIKKYGDRGRKISNLCTAGYFESKIVPLLNEMKKSSDFSKEKFSKIYDLLIQESAFAIFVSEITGQIKLTEDIRSKIQSNIRYGIKYIYIHGIGKANVEKIKESVEEILKQSPQVEKNVEETKNVITVKLMLDKVSEIIA